MRALPVLTLATLAFAVLNGMAVAATIGDVEAVKQTAFGTPPNATKVSKHEGDNIAFNELLETLQKSGMLVKFDDGSKLTLGANSRVLVDDFVYDPGNSGSKALVSIPTGTLRYVTGAMPKGHTTIDTPTATMVLRGTNVTVGVGADGTTTLYVQEGKVSVHNKITGADTEVDAGNGVDISSNGINASDHEQTGDPVVDSGFADNTDSDTGGNTIGTPEQRRGEDTPSRPEKAKKSGGNTGGKPKGGKTGGNTSGGSTSGGGANGGATTGGGTTGG